MIPLARVWTWTGGAFLAVAITWVVANRGGQPGPSFQEGILISQAYMYLIAALASFAALVWIFALYVKSARRSSAEPVVPPNMLFETATERNPLISWVTAVVFLLTTLAGLFFFGSRYGTSVIHDWESQREIASGFWASRIEAHRLGCAKGPCFALAQHRDPQNNPINGVWEYVLLWTDGVLLLLILLGLAGVVFLGVVFWRRPPRPLDSETG
jgi:hypothetical protein